MTLSSEHPLPADWNIARNEPSIVRCTLASDSIWIFNGLFTDYECHIWRKASLDIGYEASHEITPIAPYVPEMSMAALLLPRRTRGGGRGSLFFITVAARRGSGSLFCITVAAR